MQAAQRTLSSTDPNTHEKNIHLQECIFTTYKAKGKFWGFHIYFITWYRSDSPHYCFMDNCLVMIEKYVFKERLNLLCLCYKFFLNIIVFNLNLIFITHIFFPKSRLIFVRDLRGSILGTLQKSLKLIPERTKKL